MKVKIGSRLGEITPEYFAKFGKNKGKFGKALKFMCPDAKQEHIDDIWKQMGGVEQPIKEEVVEQVSRPQSVKKVSTVVKKRK